MPTKEKIIEDWQKAFTEEFGIHFKDSKGELQFALLFIEDLLRDQKQEIVEEIEHMNDKANSGYQAAMQDIIKKIQTLNK